MSDIIPIFWHRGLSYDARSALQEPGILKRAKNVQFRKNGVTSLRPVFGAVNSTALNATHSIKRFKNILVAGDSTNLRFRSVLTTGDFTSMGAAFASDPYHWDEYKNCLFGANGTNHVIVDENGNCYPARIENPATAPTGADSGVAGNPNGVYALYYSFHVTFPNGQTYETGISTVSGDVTVASKKITWTVPVSSYAAYYGTAPTIKRKLYRGPGTGGTLGDTYYVAEIADNTTTTYTDDFTDAQLAANGAVGVDEYDAPPVNIKRLAVNYGRFYYVTTDNPHRLYYTDVVAGADGDENELLLPLSVGATNWDDLRTSGVGEVDPQGLVTWGTYLYIPLKQTWIRKEGNTPATWSYKKTWATTGIAAPFTIDKSLNPSGILGVSMIGETPALTLFNGQTTQWVGQLQLQDIFESDLNVGAIANCRGRFDGRHYHLLYPSGSSTQPDKWAAIDMSRGLQDIRISEWEDLHGQSIDVYNQGSGVYIGGSDGIVRQNSGVEAINVEVECHDIAGAPGNFGHPNLLKVLKALKYNLDTANSGVDLRFVLDGEAKRWIDTDAESASIKGMKDAVQRLSSLPNNFEAYRFSLKITGKGLTKFDLYSPWAVEYDVK